MKILYIVTAYQRSEDDIITPWMVETIRSLKKKGVDITVYAPSYRGLGDQMVGGVSVKRFRYFFRRWENFTHDSSVPEKIRENSFYILMTIPYILFGVLGLNRVLKEEKFDLIHVHWPFPHFIFGWWAKNLTGLPVISEFYGVELRWVQTKMRKMLPFMRWVIKSSDQVVAISSHTRNEVNKIVPGTEAEIIPYGSPVPEMKDLMPLSTDSSRTRRILFVGRIVERKGVEYLVKSLKHVDCPYRVELDIVGTDQGGGEIARLKKLAAENDLTDRVIFHGLVDDETLRRCYAECDISVLPAIVDSKGDTEGLGVVLIEALTYRKPVIASGVGGIVDIVKDEQTGILVPEKDPVALGKAISRLLTDNELSLRLAEQGYEFVREYFGWETISRKWVDYYERILEPFR